MQTNCQATGTGIGDFDWGLELETEIRDWGMGYEEWEMRNGEGENRNGK